MPTYRLVSAIACGALGTAMACSSFGSAPATNDVTPDGGMGDAGSSGSGSSGSFEAGVVLPDGAVIGKPGPSVVQGDGTYLTCPPTSTKSKFGNLSRQLVVGSGTGFDYPFGIVADVTSIFWVSQFVDNGATEQQKTEAYNGHAKARIHRAPKGQVTNDPASTVIVDKENEGVVAIALDGDYIYWAAPKMSGSSTLSIRRVTRDCTKPCVPVGIAEINSAPIVSMRRARPGLIYALGGEGRVFAIEPNKNSAMQISPGAGDLPNFAVTNEHAFVAGGFNTKVLRVAKDSSIEHGTFLDTASPEKGCGPMATDCTRIYAWRKLDFNIWAADATNASVFQKFADVNKTSVYDAFADNDYVYLGSLNGGGIAVIDSTTSAVVRTYPGSYFRLWADDTGLYSGEHDTGGPPGAIYRFGD